MHPKRSCNTLEYLPRASGFLQIGFPDIPWDLDPIPRPAARSLHVRALQPPTTSTQRARSGCSGMEGKGGKGADGQMAHNIQAAPASSSQFGWCLDGEHIVDRSRCVRPVSELFKIRRLSGAGSGASASTSCQ